MTSSIQMTGVFSEELPQFWILNCPFKKLQITLIADVSFFIFLII